MLRFEHVSLSYGSQKIIDDISFEIQEGQMAVLIGSSGCGKTTTLKMINRLIEPTSGKIYINGKDIAAQDRVELRRHIGYVIQQIGLFPNMTVAQNICVVPNLLKYSKEACDKIVHELLELVDLPYEQYAHKYPSEMSGGQQQRIGILRALAASPPIVLMDEPFSALDPMTRAELQDEVHRLQLRFHKTIVFVTHDMDEAVKLADRICIIQDGKVAQCDTPENILKHPANQYVTEFIGANRLWANPEYIRAADIMRRRPFTISKGRTVIQALQIMRHNSVDSLLVLDKGQTLLGVVWLEELIGKREADPIEYYISDDYIAVEGETSLKEIIATIDYDVSGIIPVIQHDRKLLGYLTKSIILATMSKQFVPEHTAGERSGVICPATL